MGPVNMPKESAHHPMCVCIMHTNC